MKLLFVNASLTDGGSERAMSLVAQALAARGHDVTMVLVREKERTYSMDTRVNIVQLRFGSSGKIRKLFSRLRQLRQVITNGSYDFVVCYMWDLNITTLAASLGTRARVLVSERGFPGTTTRTRTSKVLERLLYVFAHRIIYQTRDAQSYCPRTLRHKSLIMPNMIESLENSGPSDTREKRIVSIGRLGPQKNFPLLLRSFTDFLSSHPEWRLEILGKGALENELKDLATTLGIRESVDFVGYVADVPARIQNAGMFVLASDFEGISNAMAEAMALGLPVVCTDCPVGGAALLIDNRISGMLVPVRDQTALTQAMDEVASDAALAEQLSRGARQSVARFTPERLAREWEDRVLC